MTIVDADAHVIETPITFSFMEDRQPILTTQSSGAALLSNEGKIRSEFWIVDNHVRAKDRNVNTTTLQSSREMTDVQARLSHMDDLKVDIQVLFPTLFLRPLTHRTSLELAMTQSYNRWLGGIWKNGSARLRWIALPPLRSPSSAIEYELEWCKDHGACGIFMRPFECERLVSDPFFFPLYELATKLDLPLCWHAGNGSFQIHDFFIPAALPTHKLSMIATFHEILMAELPSRFPDTKWAFIEASAQWIPYAIKDLEIRKRKQGKKACHDWLEDNNIWVAAQVEDDFEWVLQYASEDHLVIGTDYGHTDTASELNALRFIYDCKAVSSNIAEKITSKNAMKLYSL